MLTIQNLEAGQAQDYYKDGYYTKDQQAGQWQGKTVDVLSLSGGKVSQKQFVAALNGKDPHTNKQLIQKSDSDKHRAGIDLTFSAPKGVSVVYAGAAIIGDKQRQKELMIAQQKAVSRTLSFIEQYADARQTTTVDGIKQTTKIRTGNLLVAKFDHITNRNNDPQLHTHAVVLNITQRPDGKMRAIDNKFIYDHQKFFGQVYRNEMAKELSNLGFQIEQKGNGLFDIAGVSEQVKQAYSTRTQEIADKTSALLKQYPNADIYKLKQKVCLATRKTKTNMTMGDLLSKWQQQAKSIDIYQLKNNVKTEHSLNDNVEVTHLS